MFSNKTFQKVIYYNIFLNVPPKKVFKKLIFFVLCVKTLKKLLVLKK